MKSVSKCTSFVKLNLAAIRSSETFEQKDDSTWCTNPKDCHHSKRVIIITWKRICFYQF